MVQQLVPNEVIPRQDQEPQPYSSTQQQIPPQPSYIIQNVPVGPQQGCCGGRSEKFMDTAGVSTGVIQIVLAVIILILSVVPMIKFNLHLFFLLHPYFGRSIWNAIMFILPAGILGVCTKTKKSCVIIGYLVMSILAAAYSLTSAIYEGSLAVAYGSYGYSDPLKVLYSIITFCTVIEFIVAIVAAGICCGGLAFCCAGSAPAQHPAVTLNVPVGPQEGCCRGRSETFRDTAGVSTGVIQIVLAVIILILAVIIQLDSYNFYLDICIDLNAIVFILPAGILGACTKKKNSGVIISCLVMSILAALFSLVLAIFEGFVVVEYDSLYSYGHRLKVLYSFITFFTVVEFIVATVAAAFCCGGLACCSAGSTPVQHPAVAMMNYPAPISGPQNATAQANVNHGTEFISAQP